MKNIKDIREKELKLDQQEVAKLLNMSQGTISRIESNKLFGKNYKRYLDFLRKKGVDLNEATEKVSFFLKREFNIRDFTS